MHLLTSSGDRRALSLSNFRSLELRTHHRLSDSSPSSSSSRRSFISELFLSMSGYRSLHRHRAIPNDENGDPGCVWGVCATATPFLASTSLSLSSSQPPPHNNHKFRLFIVGSTDSNVRSFLVEESSLKESGSKNDGDATSSSSCSSLLDASAARVSLTHLLVDQSSSRQNRSPRRQPSTPRSDHPPAPDGDESQSRASNPDNDDPSTPSEHHHPVASVGCSRVCVTRNYVGQDDSAGNLVVVTLDLLGTLRVWELDAATFDNERTRHNTTATPPLSSSEKDDEATQAVGEARDIVAQRIPAAHQTVLREATGTALALCRPPVEGPVCVAVGCLDGSVRLVATGLVTPKYSASENHPLPAIGTILRSWGGRGSALPLALCWKPDSAGGTNGSLAVGRQDGTIDLVSVAWGVVEEGGSTRPATSTHRLIQHTTPVRALAYTPDGALLLSGSDEGLLCVWDASRGNGSASSKLAVPPLVHHLWCGNNGGNSGGGGDWILQILPFPDSRRFAVATQARQILVWDLEHPHQVSHTFETDAPCYAGTVVNSDALDAAVRQQARHRPNTRRIVTGNDTGWVQLYSIE